MCGNPEVTPGGRALKFYSSVRMEIRRIDSIKNGVDVIGNRVRVKVVKNKIAPPFKFTEFDIVFGKGISKEGDLLDLGTNFGVIEKSGTWFSCKQEKMGQGRESAKQKLRESEKLSAEVEKEIKEKVLQLKTGTNKKKEG